MTDSVVPVQEVNSTAQTERITYRTLNAASFEKTGELPKGTRRVQILIDRPGGMLFGHYRIAEAEKIIEDNYARGSANFPAYYLVRDETKRMDAETIAKLAALTEEKRIKKLADEAALDNDNAVASAELKDQEAE